MYQINDLNFKYPKNEEATIKGISFEVKDGEIFGLLGPSGVGKSTTQKILTKQLGIYGGEILYSGEILYKGEDLKSYDKSFLYR